MSSFRGTLRRDEPTNVPGSKPAADSVSADDVIARLQKCFFRLRIRPLQFFEDYDKLRSSLITENQFICGLSLALSGPKAEALNRDELRVLLSRFAADGRVNYREFCNVVDQCVW